MVKKEERGRGRRRAVETPLLMHFGESPLCWLSPDVIYFRVSHIWHIHVSPAYHLPYKAIPAPSSRPRPSYATRRVALL